MKIIKTIAGVILSCTMILSSSSCSLIQRARDLSFKDSSYESVVSETDSSSSEAEAESLQADETSSDEKQTPSDITPAMWKVTDKDGMSMTLVGSMHVLKEEDYPFPDKIMKEYNNADVLAVECDALSYSEDMKKQMALLKEMYLNDGTKLKDHISAEAYTCLEELLKSYGSDVSTLSGMKTWAAANTIDSLATMYSGLDSDKGFDSYFLGRYKDDGKQLYEVKSVQFQLDMLMDLSDEAYDAIFLCYKNQTKQTQIDSLMKLYKAWRTGDVETLENLMQSDDADGIELTQKQEQLLEDYTNQMYYDRNKNMVKAIEELLQQKKNVFYVVGAAHYVGEGGILDLLEKDGYSIERMNY